MATEAGSGNEKHEAERGGVRLAGGLVQMEVGMRRMITTGTEVAKRGTMMRTRRTRMRIGREESVYSRT